MGFTQIADKTFRIGDRIEEVENPTEKATRLMVGGLILILRLSSNLTKKLVKI